MLSSLLGNEQSQESQGMGSLLKFIEALRRRRKGAIPIDSSPLTQQFQPGIGPIELPEPPSGIFGGFKL